MFKPELGEHSILGGPDSLPFPLYWLKARCGLRSAAETHSAKRRDEGEPQ
jgi:hypothetical protein